MKKKTWLFAIIISVACLHANSQKANAQGTTPAVGNASQGEDGSSEIRIEPNDTPRAAEIRALLKASETKGVRKSTARATGKVIEFIKPPDTSAIYPAFRTNMMEGLKTERQVGAGDTAFVPLADGSVIRPTDITVTPYNNGGRYPSAGFVFRVSNPAADSFVLGSVSYVHESSDVSTGKPLGELGFSGNFQTNNLSITRIGVDAGLDGVLGTLDDIIYTSGPPTLKLHALFYRGVAHWFEERSPENTGDVERYLAGKQPYFIRTTYVVANLGSASGTLYVQPVQQPAPPAPVITSFTASKSNIVAGEALTIGWSTTNAASVLIQPAIGAAAVNGSVVVALNTSTTYTLTAIGAGGTTAQATLRIVVEPLKAPTITMTATAQEIQIGGSVMVTYTTTDTTTLNVSPGIGNIAVNGGISFAPNVTTRYTFTATGHGGVISTSLTVTVTAPPAPQPPPFTIALGVKSGNTARGAKEELVVTNDAPLTLFGYVQNRTAGSLTLIDLFYQTGRTTNEFQTWVSAGAGGVTLAPGVVGETEPHNWKAGQAEDGSFYFRLAAKANGIVLTSDWVGVRVVPGPEPISLSVIRQGTSVKIQLKGPPGTYYIEDALQATGPWLRGGEALTVTAGQVPEILYTRGDRLKGFFRAVRP